MRLEIIQPHAEVDDEIFEFHLVLEIGGKFHRLVRILAGIDGAVGEDARLDKRAVEDKIHLGLRFDRPQSDVALIQLVLAEFQPRLELVGVGRLTGDIKFEQAGRRVALETAVIGAAALKAERVLEAQIRMHITRVVGILVGMPAVFFAEIREPHGIEGALRQCVGDLCDMRLADAELLCLSIGIILVVAIVILIMYIIVNQVIGDLEVRSQFVNQFALRVVLAVPVHGDVGVVAASALMGLAILIIQHRKQ
ncbi:MAG: hypothetical protein BWY83_02015 [bacterium ADurb.Bin478]|nr:MAG: hypothetical protein BWY83_02015 [bacterium ADurb.Bin478]